MNIKQRIIKRRNVKPKFFNGKRLQDSLIENILEAANWAPTHANTEPWRFVVFSDNAINEFAKYQAELYKKEVDAKKFSKTKHEKLLKTPLLASHIVAVISKNSNSKIAFLEEVVATSCAVQNILLVAAENNVAVHWTTGGMTYSNSLKTYLGYSEPDQVLGFLYFGYCDEKINIDGIRISSIGEKVRWIR